MPVCELSHCCRVCVRSLTPLPKPPHGLKTRAVLSVTVAGCPCLPTHCLATVNNHNGLRTFYHHVSCKHDVAQDKPAKKCRQGFSYFWSDYMTTIICIHNNPVCSNVSLLKGQLFSSFTLHDLVNKRISAACSGGSWSHFVSVL